ncbi:MAG: asparagine synthase (glutamine-hydrolyzing) [Chitinophagaceae bacterium]
MCGISVIVNKNDQPVQPETIKRFNDLVRHRGPDGEGFYHGNNFALGHRLLIVINRSLESSRQPMAYKDLQISFNGEIYNYPELEEELIKEGYTFHTKTDTELILAAYDRWGEKCVNKFNGMWAFILYDCKRNILFCSRDRLGIKPLCYTVTNDMFLAGSEFKQFTGIPGYSVKLNNKAAFDFLHYSNLNNDDETFFEDVKMLCAGDNLVYDLTSHRVNIYQWYNLDKITINESISFEEASCQFEQLFMDSIKLHLRSDVRMGASLSGGLDSSSIVCAINELYKGKDITTISSCFTEPKYNEIPYVDAVNAKTGFPSFKVFPDIQEIATGDLFENIVYHQDQPILGGSFFSEYKVFQTARANQITVMLSGQGVDEYLAGYPEFFMFYLKGLLKKGRFGNMGQAVTSRSKKHCAQPDQLVSSFFTQLLVRPMKLNVKRMMGQSNFIPQWMSKKWFTENSRLRSDPNPLLGKSKYYDIHTLSKHELLNFSLPHQLHSEDRNSMLHSIESRLPFLDYRLVEFSLSLPDDYKIRKGETKAVLREGLKKILPPEVVNRHCKMGFPGPDEEIFGKNNKMISSSLKEAVSMFPGIINENVVQLHEAYQQGKIPYNNILFRVLSLSKWAKVFNAKVTALFAGAMCIHSGGLSWM